jgi:hypothetical protein
MAFLRQDTANAENSSAIDGWETARHVARYIDGAVAIE